MSRHILILLYPHLVTIGIIVGFFVAAYVVYLVLLFSFRRFAKGPLFRRVVERLRLPTFLILFEAALFFSVYSLGLEDELENLIYRIILILFVLSLGWFIIRTLRTIFKYTVDLFAKDPKKRSSVIQLLFVYRIVVITVATLTLGGILMMFPVVKNVGFGLLGSAGVVGLVIGMAARPVLLNLIAGFQIALTKTINLEDAVFVEGDMGRIESIHLTHVVVRTWDLRRYVIPISQFIDKPFQNADLVSKEKIGSIFLYCDYRIPVEKLRKHFAELVESSPLYNGNFYKLHVLEMTEHTMQIRMIVTADDLGAAFDLRCYIREKMIEYIQKEFSYALPLVREIQRKET